MKFFKAFLFAAFLLTVFISMAFGTTHTITFGGMSFTPNTLNVNVGDTIVWSGAWAFHAIQSTTIPTGAAAWGPTTATTTSLSYVVSVAGTYDYQCNIHVSMGMTGSFTATAVAPSNKALTISTANVDFGSKRVTTTSTKTMTVNSTGPDVALTISSSPLSVGTMYTNSPTTVNRTINVGSSETETINFNPTARGTFYDTLTINNNATTVADQQKKIFISGSGINGIFSGAANVLFGSIRIGNSAQLTYTITNSGDDTLFLSAPIITGSGFSILSGAAQNIPPNGTGSVVVKFSPTIKQSYSGSLTMTALNNVVVSPISLGGVGKTPIISSTPSSTYDLGLAFAGTTLSGSLQINNSGDDTLHVTGISISPAQQGAKFTLANSNGFIILPGANASIGITYISTLEGTDNATLIVTSDDPSVSTMQVSLIAHSGLPKISLDTKDTIDFGNVRVGGSGHAFLNITNLGTYDLSLLFSNFSPLVFGLGSPVALVHKQESIQADFVFAPDTEGIKRGMGIINTNDQRSPLDTIYFKGMGISSALDFPSAINFSQVNVGSSRDSIILLKNFGTADAKILRYKLIDSNNVFSLPDTSTHTITAHDSVSLKIHFAPSSEAAYTAALNIVTDDAAFPNRQITFSGSGIHSDPFTNLSAIDFGQIDTGTTLKKLFTLTNKGTAPATITAVKLSGDPSFTLSSVSLPLLINADSSKDISITFTPTTANIVSGSVTITASEGSPINVSLLGKGKITVTQSVTVIDPNIGIAMQVYPNPNNGSATIGLLRSKSLAIKLSLYDATGKIIQTYDETLFQSGEDSIPLHAENLSSGEYYLRAISGGVVAGEMKVVVVR